MTEYGNFSQLERKRAYRVAADLITSSDIIAYASDCWDLTDSEADRIYQFVILLAHRLSETAEAMSDIPGIDAPNVSDVSDNGAE